MNIAGPEIATRSDLIYALTIAAEIEHTIACQYLFAAFSLKDAQASDLGSEGAAYQKQRAEGSAAEGITPEQAVLLQKWKRQLLMIARQEMAHLGLVNNLLTAVGGAPYFRRPNFPQSAGTLWPGEPVHLRPFDAEWLRSFIGFESPPAESVALAIDAVPDPPPHFATVHGHYARIRRAFVEHDWLIPGVGAQVGNDEIFGEAGVTRAYDFAVHQVTNRETAIKAIDQIMLEGEGSSHSVNDVAGHFALLKAMAAELASHPGFIPARNVVRNPVTHLEFRLASKDEATVITFEPSRQVARLFNGAYQTLLTILMRFYSRTEETERELNALQAAAFFPLMVMVIRPLGEVLTTMPAHEGADLCDPDFPRAGPTFETFRSTSIVSDKTTAWRMIHDQLRGLHGHCEEIGGQMESATAACLQLARSRLAYLQENLFRIAENFRQAMGISGNPGTEG